MTQRKSPARGPIMNYLLKHKGEIVHRDDIAQATKLTPAQVRNAMYTLCKSTDFASSVEIVLKGHAWRFHSDEHQPKQQQQQQQQQQSANRRRIFEEVGVTKDGDVLLECEDGRFFKATEL